MISPSPRSVIRTRLPIVVPIVVLWLSPLAVAGCAQGRDSSATLAASQSADPAAHAEADLTLVGDHSQVCMVNDRYMGKPQLPVDVEGKTYYGCCPMCKARLAADPGARHAIDPVSRKSVDKADAVIARTPAGSVLYFESSETLAAYASQRR